MFSAEVGGPSQPVAPPEQGGTPAGPEAPLLFGEGPLLPAQLAPQRSVRTSVKQICQTEVIREAEKRSLQSEIRASHQFPLVLESVSLWIFTSPAAAVQQARFKD